MADTSQRRSSGRLAAYRPVLDRLIFACALLGVLVAVHLWIQQGRGFDRGCLGVSTLQESATVDCGAVLQSEASTLFGVSNVLWGALFYLTITGLSLGAAYAAPRVRQRLKQARAGLVTVGFLYSLYLVYYQSFVIGTYCVLCLISAGLVTALLVLHALDAFTTLGTRAPSSKVASPRRREVTTLAAASLLVFVLAGADVMYFKNLGGGVSGECQYSTEMGPFTNYQRFVQPDDPVKGASSAPVTVIEYLDPTCPHCKQLHNAMAPVIQEHNDEARFVYKLFPLNKASLAPVLALRAAAQEGTFFAMLEQQFAAQRQGFSLERLRGMAQKIGMNPDTLERRMNDKALLQSVLQERKRAAALGINTTPTVFINGRVVAHRTPDCMSHLIERAAQQ